jgi:hypothetical protein
MWPKGRKCLTHAAMPSTLILGKGYVTCQCKKTMAQICACAKTENIVQFKLIISHAKTDRET